MCITHMHIASLYIHGSALHMHIHTSGNEVSMCIGRVAKVTALKAGIAKEDALLGLSRKFILAKSEYVDKTIAVKDTRRETKKGLIRKEKRTSDLITQYRRRHAIDQIADG